MSSYTYLFIWLYNLLYGTYRVDSQPTSLNQLLIIYKSKPSSPRVKIIVMHYIQSKQVILQYRTVYVSTQQSKHKAKPNYKRQLIHFNNN